MVIGILAAMAMPKFIGVQRNAHVAAMETDLDVIEKAVMQYVMATDDGSYPFVDTNNDKTINEEDLYFKTGTIPQTLTDTLLKANGDDGSKIYKLDMDKLKPYIDKLKYPNTDYVYSPNSDTAIDPIGKPDGDNNIHHIINGGVVSEDKKEDNIKITSLVKNKNFSIGGFYGNIYINNQNNVYGAGAMRDSYGSGTKDTLYRQYSYSSEGDAIKTASTYDNWAYITSAGEVYTMGINNDKQLGREYTYSNYSNYFDKAKLPEGVKAIDIELTQYTTVVLGDDGYLYACGYNIYFPDLYATGVYNIPTLTKLPLPNDKKVKSFDAADAFLAVVDEDGDALTIGSSGLYFDSIYKYRDWNTFHFDKPIIDIVATQNNVIAIDNTGAFYGMGKNSKGELGLGDRIERTTFTEIPMPDNIIPKSIQGGRDFVILQTTDNDLYGWGLNNYGLFGVPYSEEENFFTPRKLNYEGIGKVKTLYNVNGSDTQGFAFLGEDDIVYAIGCNDFGQYGLGHTTNIKVTPVNINLSSSIKK